MRVNPIRTKTKQLTLKDIRKINHSKTDTINSFKTRVVSEQQMQTHRLNIETQVKKIDNAFRPQNSMFDKFIDRLDYLKKKIFH